jgi:hypothetical protein
MGQAVALTVEALVTANAAFSSPIPVILMKEAIRSSETSFRTRAKRRNIAEDGILHIFLSSAI